MNRRAAIFIDGAYLERVLGGARIDLDRLADIMAGESEILRTYYYHCLPYQSDPATEDERKRYSGKRGFFSALEDLPRFEVRLGRLEFRGHRADGSPIFQQKRVDILLGVDMVQLATKRAIETVILLAGDSDFIPAVEVAKSEGALVKLFHGEEPHRDLLKVADERVLIDQKLIDQVPLIR